MQIRKETCGKYAEVRVRLDTLTCMAGGGGGSETCRQGVRSLATLTAAAAAPEADLMTNRLIIRGNTNP